MRLTKAERKYYNHVVATTDPARLPPGWTAEDRAMFLVEIWRARPRRRSDARQT